MTCHETKESLRLKKDMLDIEIKRKLDERSKKRDEWIKTHET